MFSKFFKEKSVDELIALAADLQVDGFDLCVRPGYPINPDNAASSLPEAIRRFRSAGVDVPMVTGNFDLLTPDHPTAEPILAAMNGAGVRLLKLGYFTGGSRPGGLLGRGGPHPQGVCRVGGLGRKHEVRICYHTHSHRCLG